MNKELVKRLQDFARKYETADFIKDDPVQFPRRYYERYLLAPEHSSQKKNVEISAFVTSWLCFGNRKLILNAARKVDELFEGSPINYILCTLKDKSDGRDWLELATSHKNFYRMFEEKDIGALCMRLHKLYSEHESMEELLTDDDDYVRPLLEYFSGLKGIPGNDTKSGCKRISLFLRWMIRKGPVDMGIWNKDPKRLLVPLDTHVHDMALELGLTDRANMSMLVAREITNKMKEVFPSDPAKGDFALFGYGIDKANR
jgi:uncharacterized protein (TIGR02757 family)